VSTSTAPAGTASNQPPPTAASPPKWVEPAEDFLALMVILYVSQFAIQMYKLAWRAVAGGVFLVLAAIVYPFQPELLIFQLQFGLILAIATTIVWILIHVNKNEIISRITNSTPNRFELNWSFLGSLVVYIGPIALIMVAQLSGRLRDVFEPL